MQNFKNKIVLITGASAGIGKACAEQFAAIGAKLILTARREALLTELAAQLKKQYHTEVLPLIFDVCDAQATQAAIQQLPQAWQAIDVLVNNAGLAQGLDKIQEGKRVDWDTMIDTNIKGLLQVTQAVLAYMLPRNSGHIINLGSIASHEVYPGGAVYCATKHAVKAISQGIKMDVHGTQIRVTSVDPGMVKTDFSRVRFKGDIDRADKVYEGVNYLVADDIADAVVYCATRPLHVNIREIKVYPTDQTAVHMLRRCN